jgi:hypothetical protein
MKLMIKCLNGESIHVDDINENDTVEDIKVKVSEAKKKPVYNIKLLFGTRLLEDYETVKEAGLMEGSILHLLIR